MTPDRTRTHAPDGPPTATHDPALDAALAHAFGPDPTPGGWSRPPLLRDDPSDYTPVVQPGSPEMPRGSPGRYQLLGEIARGGMGVVLKGRDPDLGRDLAVKVLKAEYAGKPAAEQRFVEEAQVCGQLQHPGVVPVYELGRFASGQPFFAMKLVKGRTLAALLAERPDPAHERGQWLKVFEKVCETVAYAHSKGVIHRDLKPANVMVGGFGEVQVMDWGLAKVIPQGGVADEQRATQASRERSEEFDPTVIRTARAGSAGSYTEAGSVMGTPAFMPPEQAGGEIDKLDERADVFGLGAILCVILTGQPPYVAESADAVRLLAVRGKLADAYARLDDCGADGELIALCKRCLAAEREDRPRHAGEVAAAVTAHLAEVEARAHRADVARAAAAAEVREQRKRRRVQAALGLAFTALMVLGGAFAWWRDRTLAEEARVDTERKGERAAVEAGARQAVESAVLLAGDLREQFRFPEAKVALDQAAALIPAEGCDDLRSKVGAAKDDVILVEELDRIRLSRMRIDVNMAAFTLPGAYRRAFQSRGVDPSAERFDGWDWILASPVKHHILIAIDDWALWENAPDRRARLFAVTRRLDPGDWSDRLRDPAMQSNQPALAELAAQTDVSRLPSHLIVLLYQMQPPGEQWPGAMETLVEVANLNRGNYWLQLEAGYYFIYKQRNPFVATGFLRAALALRPDRTYPLHLLASAARSMGDTQGLVSLGRELVRLEPGSGRAHASLGIALAQKGDWDGAIAEYREAIQLDPKSALAHNNLAWVLATGPDGVRDGKLAVEHAIKACELTQWKSPGWIDTLAAAYAEAGDFDKAVEFQKKALSFPELAKSDGKDARQRLDLYLQKKPYRDPAFAPRELAPPPRAVRTVPGPSPPPAR